MSNRREFVKRTALAGGALGIGSALLGDVAAASATTIPRASRALRILILGGTGFTGPHQIAYATARGHHITVFNRGRRDTQLPDSVVAEMHRRLMESDAHKKIEEARKQAEPV